MPVRISDKTRQAILKDYAAGVPTPQIAERYGVSKSYPTVLASRSGISLRMDGFARSAMSGRKTPTASRDAPKAAPVVCSKDEVRRLAGKGIGLTSIAALLRCSYRDVSSALQSTKVE